MSNLKNFVIYSLAISSLFLGLILNENSSGGAKMDYEYLFPFVEEFSLNLKVGLKSFLNNEGSIIHSPVFYIMLGSIYSLSNNIFVIKIFYILISSLLPYLFYCILRNKFSTNKKILFLFSLLIFLSPYFRSSAIWLLGDNLSLIFFGLSIFYFNKIKKYEESSFKFSFFCLFFLILACYIRYYYCLFSIYYLIFFFKSLKKKDFFLIVSISAILSLPALLYLNFIFINFEFGSTVSIYSKINFYNNSLVICSMLLFYLIPFCLIQGGLVFKYLINNKKFISSLFVVIFFLYFLDELIFFNLIDFSPKGGGVFTKIAHFFGIQASLFLSFTTFISIIIFDYFFKEKRLQNYFLVLILIFSFPVYSIYQKYFDPLFFLFFFGLINSNNLFNSMLNGKKLLLISLSYFLSFYFFALIYYSSSFKIL